MKNMWLVTTTRRMKREPPFQSVVPLCQELVRNQMGRGARAFFLLSACALLMLCPQWTRVAHALNASQLYAQSAPGVVLLMAHGAGGKGGSAGTGSIITPDGRILTNAHVVVNPDTGKPYDRVFTFLKPPVVNGDPKNDLTRRSRAVVEMFSQALDLALVKMENPPTALPVLKLCDPDQVGIGDMVAAIGHPEQGGLWTLTTGVVSAQFVNFGKVPGKHVFQTETGLNRGNSGGPLINDCGQIGVNTAIARLAADGMPIVGINFAIKSSVARDWLRGRGIVLEYAKGEVPAAAEVAEEPSVPQTQEAPTDVTPVQPQRPVVQERDTLEPGAEAAGPAETLSGPPAPQTHTKAHPYNMDDLVASHYRRLERELEGMMAGMREQIRRRR